MLFIVHVASKQNARSNINKQEAGGEKRFREVQREEKKKRKVKREKALKKKRPQGLK